MFTSCATESNNLAIHGYVCANNDKGKHIITSSVEHPSVMAVCQFLASQGYDVTYLPVNEYACVNPADVEKAIRPDTILITIMHANNEVGTIQPLSKISAIAKKNKVVFHTDASQSAGKIETNVKSLGVDLLTVAGHKLYAPKGIGALYVKQGVKIGKLMHGANQEKGLSPGTENVSFCVGLGKACEIAKRDFDKSSQTMMKMRDRLFYGLKNNLGNQLRENVDLQKCLPNTLSVSFCNVDAHTLSAVINKEVYISTGSACHAGSVEISAVLKAMKLDDRTAASTVRISTGKQTTTDDIDFAIEVICNAVKKISN